jgi:hypothetical protein
MTAIWDEAFLKQHERNAREDALAVQSDEDWKSAELLLERAMSDACDGYVECPLSACRRAYRCVGNRPICLPRCKVEFEPGGEQQMFEDFYAEIQQERRDAAAENRAPRVERVRKDRVHVEDEDEDEDLGDEPAAKSAEGELERNMQIAREALRREDALSPPPQPNLAKPEPSAAPPPVAPVAVVPPEAPAAPATPPQPDPWQPQISPETEERVNQIWADYVAGKPMPRPEPRIRSLSDDRPWSVPPGWKGPR